MQDGIHNRDEPGRSLNVQHPPGIAAGRGFPQLDIKAVSGVHPQPSSSMATVSVFPLVDARPNGREEENRRFCLNNG